jgi:hypothetical protein
MSFTINNIHIAFCYLQILKFSTFLKLSNKRVILKIKKRMNKENLHSGEPSLSLDSNRNEMIRNLVAQVFDENEKEIQTFLNKYLNKYLKSDQDEQMMLAELDAFHTYIKDYENYLNTRINTLKERITKITKLFGQMGSD